MKTLNQTNTPIQSVDIHITEQNKIQLEKMIATMLRNGKQQGDLAPLIAELERANVVNFETISRNTVTMNSRVSIIDTDSSERLKFTLVYPEDADAANGKISVLSPIGAGMLGYAVGDEVTWAVPAGIRKFTIAKVDHQPEAIMRAKKPKL